MSWRRWNALIHRDLGYLIVGLTVVYSISGLAVNHIADWNPNYRKISKCLEIGPLDRGLEERELAQQALSRLKELKSSKGTFQPDGDTLEIFMKDGKYSVDLPTGKVLYEGMQPRPVLQAMNRLHLNKTKRAWTLIADLYALSLLVVVLTGLFILKGKNGLAGRGAWLTAAGALLPIGYWIWWTYFT